MSHPSQAPDRPDSPVDPRVSAPDSALAVSAAAPLLPWPELDDLVAHDFTHTQVNRFAVFAARHCRGVDGMDMADRAEVARFAILEHLYTAERCPEAGELVWVGWQAMKRERRRHLQTHGLNSKTPGRPTAAHAAYWTTTAAHTASPEDLVVDHLAFHQIWATLTPLMQQALTAVATHGTPAKAAAEVGVSEAAFTSRLTRARRLFRTLWHEGESVPARWGCDRDGARHQNAMYLLRLRTRTRQARENDPERPPPRTEGPPRKDLGISPAELLTRREAGATLKQLAAQLGVGRWVIAARLDEAYRAREDADVEQGAGPQPGSPPTGSYAAKSFNTGPTPPRPASRRVPLPVSDAELARRHHEEHTSLNALAAEYGTSPQTIRRRVQAATSAAVPPR